MNKNLSKEIFKYSILSQVKDESSDMNVFLRRITHPAPKTLDIDLASCKIPAVNASEFDIGMEFRWCLWHNEDGTAKYVADVRFQDGVFSEAIDLSNKKDLRQIHIMEEVVDFDRDAMVFRLRETWFSHKDYIVQRTGHYNSLHMGYFSTEEMKLDSFADARKEIWAIAKMKRERFGEYSYKEYRYDTKRKSEMSFFLDSLVMNAKTRRELTDIFEKVCSVSNSSGSLCEVISELEKKFNPI